MLRFHLQMLHFHLQVLHLCLTVLHLHLQVLHLCLATLHLHLQTDVTFTGVTFDLIYFHGQVLHYADTVAASDHEWGTSWSGWNWKDGNYEGSRSGTRHHGLRLQLFRTDGLQG